MEALMKRLLMVVAALAIAVSAYAESSPIPGASLSDEARKDRDLEYQHTDVINGTTSAGNALVSSAKLTRGWNWLGVQIYLGESSSQPGGGHADSCGIVYMAVMVRGGYVAATDTMSSAPYIEPKLSSTNSGGAPDTMGTAAGHNVGVASDVAGLTMALMPGEKIVPIHYSDGKRSGYFVLPDYRSRYTTIRVRVLGCAGTTSLGTIYVATGAGAGAIAMTVRCDLQGGR
jgi:hypothetical protein